MQEMARIDAIKTSQVKTTFLSSLSHELRSPLHGILGSVQLMRSTPLDSFQNSMVNSITICGRTLLETVQHLLDHAERKDPGRNESKRTFPTETSIRITSELPALDLSQDLKSTAPFCNIGLVTEEVVETMFLGQGRFDVSISGDDVPGALINPSTHNEIARRRSRFLIVDIGDYANLDFAISASSYGRLVMNILGNALKFTESGYILIWLRSNDADASKASVTLKINDSGVGMSRDFLTNEAFEPFRKYNPHSAGTGVGLNVVQRIIEDVGGSIEIMSQPDRGTDVTLRLPLERNKRSEEPESPHNSILASISQLKSRRICILHSKSPDDNGPPESLRHWQMLKRYVDALYTTLREELKMVVTLTSEWDVHDESDVVICPEVSFEGLQAIRSVTHRRPPATLLIAIDTLEADTLRCDARITSKSSIVEVMTQPCGPYKLGMVLSQCLKRYDGTSADSLRSLGVPLESFCDKNDSQLVSELGPRLGECAPMPFRPKADSFDNEHRLSEEDALPPLETSIGESKISPLPKIEETTKDQQVLIVDDNAINRRLLSVFMKKQKLPFKEAKDGLQALEAYKEAGGKFDIILMDISMPVMDGMTSTRMIREHETEQNMEPAHIIALTGLTSASAKLEAWSSGVDDFLTKPVDFKDLESLMKAGRRNVGKGFLNEESKKKVDEKLP
ncbi:Nn.00g037280.m01.CDS01 [Neocucurbitaria sp. VM-36]